MDFLIVKLDPDTRDELYSDIHPNLVDFLLLEAITLAGKEMTNNFDEIHKDHTGIDTWHMNDPELDMDGAVRGVLDVMEAVDREAGVDVEAEDYDVEDQYSFINDKMMLAVASVTFANTIGDILMFHKLITDPKYARGLKVKGTHLGGIATLNLTAMDETGPNEPVIVKDPTVAQAVELVKEKIIDDLRVGLASGEISETVAKAVIPDEFAN